MFNLTITWRRLMYSIPMTLAFAAITAWSAPAQARAAHPLAQRLVTSVQASHMDVTEVGIELPSAKSCTTIASTDPGDAGDKCESDDILPLKTGKPSVVKESDGYDVSVLLHDSSGRQIGVLGIEMKLTGHTRTSALAEARRIEREMAKQITSRASLVAH
ncbi:MAG: hypothetical protein ACRD1M_08265 [Terriglobales bacterium]